MKTIKTIGKFRFECNSQVNPLNGDGIYHMCYLYENDKLMDCASVLYSNRSWEAYRYQSIMQQAVRHLIQEAPDPKRMKELKGLFEML